MPGVTPAKQRLDFLDVARGVAALMVLAEHGLDDCLPGFLRAHLGHGNLGRAGVLLFLLISGFIIPASLEQCDSNARFWLRRFFRLFPAYWLSIAVAYGASWHRAWSGVGVPLDRPGDWLLNLTMLEGFFGRPYVWGVFWTLQLELIIYAGCSVLHALRLLPRAKWIAVLILAGYALIGLGRPLLEGKFFGINGERCIYFAPLVGLVAHRYWAGQLSRGALLLLGLGQGLVLAATWSLNHALFPAGVTAECLQVLACTWGIAYACFFPLLALRRWRMPKVTCWLGRISYSVYLLHPLVLMILAPAHWPAWLFLPVLLAGTLLLAQLAYRFVEVPGIALGRALERRWWPAVVKPTPQAALGRIAA
jgi:peptidoglycan/LPS O-acetylase OafA/YrhL